MRKIHSYIKLNMMNPENLSHDLDEISINGDRASETTFINSTYNGNSAYNTITEPLTRDSATNGYTFISKKKIAIACASVISLSAIAILLSKLLYSPDDNDNNMTTEKIYNITTPIMTTAFSNITSSPSSITTAMPTFFPANITSPATEDPACVQLPECCDSNGQWICK